VPLNDLWQYDPTTRQWTWLNGSDTGTALAGVYGSKGVAAPANIPGGRSQATAWSDSLGSIWLLGGEGFDVAGTRGTLNDLWKLNTVSGEWTWTNGATTVNDFGHYGTLGSAGATNTPGGRSLAASWLGANDTLWLMGGYGHDSSDPVQRYLNDLWFIIPQ
jgi:Galactose oxidase, central domain